MFTVCQHGYCKSRWAGDLYRTYICTQKRYDKNPGGLAGIQIPPKVYKSLQTNVEQQLSPLSQTCCFSILL